MSIIYPAMIAEHEKDYLVFVPDLDIFTEGKSYPEAILMARDAIGIYLITIQEAGLNFSRVLQEALAERLAN